MSRLIGNLENRFSGNGVYQELAISWHIALLRAREL